MKKITIFILISLFVFFVACTKKGSESENLSELIKIEKIININLDDNTSFYSKSMFIYTDSLGYEYLSMENELTNEINIYQLDSCNLYQKVKLELEGPNGVGRILGHKLLGMNEILVSGINTNYLFKVNKKGNVLQRIKISNDKEPLMPQPMGSIVYTPMVILDSCIFLAQFPKFQESISGSDLEQSPICIVVDTIQHTSKTLPLGYPKLWSESKKEQPSTYFSREFDGENFIYSFYIEDDIYLTKDHLSFSKHSMKSRYIKPYRGEISNQSIAKSTVQYCENPFYGNLIYDKYRKVYYRFVYLESSMGKNEDPMVVLDYRKRFSIIISDSDFNILGETLFPENTYIPTMCFINKDGLYLSENNPQNPFFSEDVLRFRCFKLSENNIK